MKVQTISITVAAPRDEVFNLLGDVERLGEWAPGLCRRLSCEGTYRKAVTPIGEMFLSLQSDPGTGVVDLLLGETAEAGDAFHEKLLEFIRMIDDAGVTLAKAAAGRQLPGITIGG